VIYAQTGQHEALFATPALSIAVFAATDQIAHILKKWTEEALHVMQQPEQGERFFFCSLDVSKVSPEEMYLSPVWEQSFSATKIPLLVLEEHA
jgi:hypothetical protein